MCVASRGEHQSLAKASACQLETDTRFASLRMMAFGFGPHSAERAFIGDSASREASVGTRDDAAQGGE